MGRAGFRYRWSKMEAAAEDRTGWRQVVCGLCSKAYTSSKSCLATRNGRLDFDDECFSTHRAIIVALREQ